MPPSQEEESLTHNRQHLLLDAAFFMGRSFRVGWGPAWTLVHATSPSSSSEMNAISSTRLDSNAFATASFPVRISSLRVADHLTADAPGVAQTLEDSLKVQLEESEMVSAESELSCPEFRPKGKGGFDNPNSRRIDSSTKCVIDSSILVHQNI